MMLMRSKCLRKHLCLGLLGYCKQNISLSILHLSLLFQNTATSAPATFFIEVEIAPVVLLILVAIAVVFAATDVAKVSVTEVFALPVIVVIKSG